MAEDKNKKVEELQDEQLSKVNGGGSSFWEEFLRVFSGDSG